MSIGGAKTERDLAKYLTKNESTSNQRPAAKTTVLNTVGMSQKFAKVLLQNAPKSSSIIQRNKLIQSARALPQKSPLRSEVNLSAMSISNIIAKEVS